MQSAGPQPRILIGPVGWELKNLHCWCLQAVLRCWPGARLCALKHLSPGVNTQDTYLKVSKTPRVFLTQLICFIFTLIPREISVACLVCIVL